ncbi:hypothetical protein MG293_008033 [Ovis ammon polii]|uniref:Uncharacterized protein n=1 Tax=Ovis ammon polii TaxID=230172 RepID=A0AAD4U7S3_OVIAM|nr:hypothetical protein MG293_008033 [Ovis ammon polii]
MSHPKGTENQIHKTNEMEDCHRISIKDNGKAVQKLSEENQGPVLGHDLCGPCEFTAEHGIKEEKLSTLSNVPSGTVGIRAISEPSTRETVFLNNLGLRSGGREKSKKNARIPELCISHNEIFLDGSSRIDNDLQILSNSQLTHKDPDNFINNLL